MGINLIATPLGGCGNAKYPASRSNNQLLIGCVVFNNAATPKGVAIKLPRLVIEGNRFIRYRSFAHPLAMFPEPPRGFSIIPP